MIEVMLCISGMEDNAQICWEQGSGKGCGETWCHALLHSVFLKKCIKKTNAHNTYFIHIVYSEHYETKVHVSHHFGPTIFLDDVSPAEETSHLGCQHTPGCSQ